MSVSSLALQRYRWMARLKDYIAIRNRRGKKEDFSYSNLMEDIILKVLQDRSIELDVLEDKLHELVKTYVAEKEKSKKTKTPICVAPRHSSLEYIFWDSPIIYNIHTLNMGRYHIKKNTNHVVNSSDSNIYATTLVAKTNRKRKFLDEVSANIVMRLYSEKLDRKGYYSQVRRKKFIVAETGTHKKRLNELEGENAAVGSV